jgi:murein DD-endopeptidase MepM/ murein hydrolase activator NlpD
LAFEPDSQDQTIINKQRDEIAVSIGQIVKQGDLIGRLVVPLPSSSQVFGPHVHWGVDQLDTQGKPTRRYTKCSDATGRIICAALAGAGHTE